MSDPLRTDPARALDGAPEPGREAKIEQLLLLGLDHYFAAEYEQAVNVWTRALFLDRSHPRARAYIERARSALSERLRQSEELLHDGVSAFNRGDASEARRLLEAAMLQGAPSDQALALLDRLNRLEQGTGPQVQEARGERAAPDGVCSVRGRRSPWRRTRVIAWSATALIIVAAAAIFAVPEHREVAAVLTQPEPQAAPSPSAVERPLPIPRRAETAISRARALAASGRLHDALQALDLVRITDPLRPEADRLRADIQQQLLAVNGAAAMKCPKCGYLGFDDVERCRNCGYDFSLVPAPDPELEIRSGDAACRLVLDDLALIDAAQRRRNTAAPAPTPVLTKLPLFGAGFGRRPAAHHQGVAAAARRWPFGARLRKCRGRAPRRRGPRCSTCRSPRSRKTVIGHAARGIARQREAEADGTAPAGMLSRLVAVAIDLAVLPRSTSSSSTSRCRSAGSTAADLDVLPKAPLMAFFVVQNGGYLVAFTAGGQTLGKMAMGIKVISTAAASRSTCRIRSFGRCCGCCSPFPPGSGF